MLVGFRREIASLVCLATNPGLFALANQKGYVPAVYPQAVRLSLKEIITPGGRTMSASLLTQPEQNRVRLKIAAHLQAKGLSELTGKVSLIGTGNYDLMSAHGGRFSVANQETELVAFRIGTVEYPLNPPLRITLGK